MAWAVLLLSACLSFSAASSQGRAGQEEPWEGREARLGSGRYEKWRGHLGTVRALSGRCWRFLACRMWQEDCGEEAGRAAKEQRQREEEAEAEEGGTAASPEHQGWNLPFVTEMVSRWYCNFGKCCATGDCRVINNITGLELDLSKRLHGQHLVKHVLLKAVQGFLETPEPEKALTLSFHGWSGTGKNFVARMMAERLYRDGLKSDCVRVFISLFHFPHSKYVDIYKVQLAKEVNETMQLCEQSLFIFDEAEKLHAGLFDALKPYVDHYDSMDMVNYRKSIFVFLSNAGGNIINEVALNFWRAGRAREEITMEILEPYLRTELIEVTDEEYTHNSLLEENLIDFLVPFLPLEYHHVKLCARDAFLARGLPFTEEALDEVARMMVFVPNEEKLFSVQGCKSISQRINYFIP